MTDINHIDQSEDAKHEHREFMLTALSDFIRELNDFSKVADEKDRLVANTQLEQLRDLMDYFTSNVQQVTEVDTLDNNEEEAINTSVTAILDSMGDLETSMTKGIQVIRQSLNSFTLPEDKNHLNDIITRLLNEIKNLTSLEEFLKINYTAVFESEQAQSSSASVDKNSMRYLLNLMNR